MYTRVTGGRPRCLASMALLCLGLAASGCGGSSSSDGAGTGGSAGGGNNGLGQNTGGSGSPAGMTDKDYCDRACATLIGCGVLYDASCSAGCLQSPAFLSCTKTAANECNALALCTFRQASAGFCGGGSAGVPGGTGTCNQAASCEAQCGTVTNAPACNCGCWASLSPAKAKNLLINNQCAVARCSVECGPTGNGPACYSCFVSGQCSQQNAQCAAN
jgi:hypothetical protein